MTEPERRPPDTTGISSIILGIVALPISLWPDTGYFGMPLAALGFVLGTAAMYVATNRSGDRMGFAVAGTAISFFALMAGAYWLRIWLRQ